MQHKKNGLAIAVAAVLALPLSQQAFAEDGCADGYTPSGTELISSNLLDAFANFTTGVYTAPYGDYPTDNLVGNPNANTAIGILEGDYVNSPLSQTTFLGNKWLAYNGSNAAADDLIFETTLNGLTAGESYLFTAYFTNNIEPGSQAGATFVAPNIRIESNGTEVGTIAICDAVSDLAGATLAADNTCADNAAADTWNKYGLTVTPNSSGIVTLSIKDAYADAEANASGNDFGMTLISFQQCSPITVALDSDEDGIPDSVDLDDDNDGILDSAEGGDTLDTDGDGIPNRLDLDSDNDGLSDILEAQGSDADFDGRVDGFTDANNDGFHDPLVSNPQPTPDTDNDGKRDFLDLDSDGDGLFDIVEGGIATASTTGKVTTSTAVLAANNGWDADAKSVLVSNSGALDADGSGVLDYLEVIDAEETTGEIITRLDGGLGSTGLGMLAGLFGLGAVRRRRALASVALVTAAAAGTAQAEQGQFFIGAGAGLSTLEPEVVNLPVTVDDTNDVGYKLFLGYDILDWLSVEGFYSQLGAAGLSNGEIDYAAYGADLVVNLPHNDTGLSGLAKIGLGAINNSSDTVDFREVEGHEIYAGLGAEYQFSNEFSLRAEYEYFDKDAQLISSSLVKRFGGAKPAPVPAPVVVAPTPEPVVETVVVEEVVVAEPTLIALELPSIYFDTDKSALRPDAIEKLNDVAALMAQYEAVTLLVSGNADARATEDYNVGLSRRRAEAAMSYLVSQGVAAERMSLQALGETSPVADNATREGRQLNRRVDFLPSPAEVVAD